MAYHFELFGEIDWHELDPDPPEDCTVTLRYGPAVVEVGFTAREDRGLVWTRFAITTEGTEPLKADYLRAFKIGEVRRLAAADASDRLHAWDEWSGEAFRHVEEISEDSAATEEDIGAALQAIEGIRRLGLLTDIGHDSMTSPSPRARRPDAFYAVVAVRYLALQAHVSRGIIAALADDLADTLQIDRPPDSHVKSWVAGATRRGFLTKGVQGQVGREPGPQLRPFIDNYRQQVSEEEQQ